MTQREVFLTPFAGYGFSSRVFCSSVLSISLRWRWRSETYRSVRKSDGAARCDVIRSGMFRAAAATTTSCRREAATICPAPVTLTFDLLTLKVVSESRARWATSVPVLVFLGLSVLELGPMYATDVRQTDRRQTASSLNAPAY